MYNAKEVDALVKEMKSMGKSKPEIVIMAATACIGWPYVWGANGQYCTVANRQACMKSSNIGTKDRQNIIDRCQVLKGTKGSCAGCKYFPNDQRTLIMDCRAFTKKMLEYVGINLSGAGATSQWNSKTNWAEKGTIDTMPKDKVCITFKYAPSIDKMDHTLIYDGNGNYIHCSGEVKKQKITEYKATHWAIPKGLYDGEKPVATTPTTSEPSTGTSSGTRGISITYPTVREGDKGEIVTQLQTFLSKTGSTLQIDGIFGPGTRSAVMAFQRKHGLTVDGIVGKQTWTKLLEVAGNIKVSEPEKPAEELGSVAIMDIPIKEVEELMKKYPTAQRLYG